MCGKSSQPSPTRVLFADKGLRGDGWKEGRPLPYPVRQGGCGWVDVETRTWLPTRRGKGTHACIERLPPVAVSRRGAMWKGVRDSPRGGGTGRICVEPPRPKRGWGGMWKSIRGFPRGRTHVCGTPLSSGHTPGLEGGLDVGKRPWLPPRTGNGRMCVWRAQFLLINTKRGGRG